MLRVHSRLQKLILTFAGDLKMCFFSQPQPDWLPSSPYSTREIPVKGCFPINPSKFCWVPSTHFSAFYAVDLYLGQWDVLSKRFLQKHIHCTNKQSLKICSSVRKKILLSAEKWYQLLKQQRTSTCSFAINK